VEKKEGCLCVREKKTGPLKIDHFIKKADRRKRASIAIASTGEKRKNCQQKRGNLLPHMNNTGKV